MCGIAGFTTPGPDAPVILARMLGALAHRGPDAASHFTDRGLALAHRRLAVVDLAGGAQPRVDPASGDALVFNGEIYGFAALAEQLRAAGFGLRDHSDTEVLFTLLRHYGVAETLARIDGMFAFAFRDGTTNTLYLARDRFGEKPLYYGQAGGTLVFGSEVSALQCHPAFREAPPDRHAAYALLQFEYLPGQLSGWQGISQVPPGGLLTFEAGVGTVTRYWSPPVTRAKITESEAVERLDGLLQGAIKQQLVADVPLGVFLSGGLDSSLITALAARQAPGITALTVRAGGGDFDETSHAIAAARHIGVRHEIVDLAPSDLLAALDAMCTHLSEPLADSSLLPTYLVCRAARARMTVALGGDGADELFAGYPNFKVQRFAWLMRRFPRWTGAALQGALSLLPPGQGYMNLKFRLGQLANGFGAPPALQSCLWMAPFGPVALRDLWRPEAMPAEKFGAAFAPFQAAFDAAPGLDEVERLLHQFLQTYLPDDILMKGDRAAMFSSLEVRAPYLHRPLAEFAASLPACLKMPGKLVLKKVARRYLPDSIIDRPKHGFALPIGGLIRGIFRERVADTLLSASNPVAPWFRAEKIAALLDRHQSGAENQGKALWALFVLFTVAGRPRQVTA